MLSGEPDLQVVGQAADGAEAIALTAELVPDVILMDLRMPGLDGVEATRRIFTRPDAPRVVVLTTYDTDGDILRAVEAGAIGYLLKDRVSDLDSFFDAVERVGGGGMVLDPEVVAQLMGRGRRDDPVAALTPREREVLELMAEGHTNAGIARRLVVSEGAVEKHNQRIFAKLGLHANGDVHRRVSAVLTLLGA